MEEYLNIYDENNVSVGEVKERKLVHQLGLWHREIAIWIMNEKNEVLIQKRAATKKLEPNKWALCAGHISSNETMIEAALREAEEEVGLKKLTPADLKLLEIQKVTSQKDTIKNNHYKYCYILKTNYKEDEFVIQNEELSAVKYISLEKLENLSEDEKKEFTSLFSKKEFKETLEKLKNKLEELKED